MDSSIVIPNYIFRPVRWPFYILLVLAVCVTVIVFEDGVLSRKEYVGFFCSIFIVIYSILYLDRVAILLDNHGITHKQIFKKNFIDWQEIRSADIEIEGHASGISLVWVFGRLNKPSYKMYVTGRKNMQLFADALISKCPDAVIANKLKRLAIDKNTSLIID